MAFEFPFERDARNNNIPPGLSLLDTGACVRLGEIYRRYRQSPEDQREEANRRAKIEKDELRREWEFQRKGAVQIAGIWKNTEAAVNACRKNPTAENAIRLCNALHGLRNDAVQSADNGE